MRSDLSAASRPTVRDGRDNNLRLATIVAIVAVFALLMPTLAHAQAAAEAKAQLSVTDALSNMYLAVRNVFRGVTPPSGSGLSIILSLYTMGIAIGGVKLAGGQDLVEAVVDWIKFSLLASFAVACVTKAPWLASMTGGAGDTVGAVIRSGFTGLGNTLAGGGMEGDQPLTIAGGFLEAAFKVLGVQVIPPAVKDDWLAIVKFVALNGLSMILAVLFIFMTIAALALSGALVVAEVLFGQLAMDLAIALAPVLVPWLLFRPLAFLFDAWLRTLLIGGMTYVVGALLSKAAGAFASQVSAIVASTFVSAESYTLDSVAAAYGGMFLMAVVFLILCERVTRLAAGFISGGAVASIGIGGMRSAIGGASAASGVGGVRRTGMPPGGGGGANGNGKGKNDQRGHAGKAGFAAGQATRNGYERARRFLSN